MILIGKKIAQRYAPNPKEIKYWIDLTEDNTGKTIKVYVNNKWVKIEDADKKEDQPIVENNEIIAEDNSNNIEDKNKTDSVDFTLSNKKFYKKHKNRYQKDSI